MRKGLIVAFCICLFALFCGCGFEPEKISIFTHVTYNNYNTTSVDRPSSSNICISGKLASTDIIDIDDGSGDYDEYSDWTDKLYDVYMEAADVIWDEYLK